MKSITEQLHLQAEDWKHKMFIYWTETFWKFRSYFTLTLINIIIIIRHASTGDNASQSRAVLGVSKTNIKDLFSPPNCCI